LAYIAREKATGGTGIDFSEPAPVVEQVIETDVPQYDDEGVSEPSDVPVVAEPEADVPAQPAEKAELEAEGVDQTAVPAEPEAEIPPSE